MPNQSDPYEILGLTKDSTREDIRKKYLLLCRIHHPDMGGDGEEFKLIVWAYELLIDEFKREKYDKYGVIDSFSREQITQYAKDNLTMLIKSIIHGNDFINNAGRIDVMVIAETLNQNNRNGAVDQLELLRKQKTNLSIAIRRIHSKKGNDNFLLHALELDKQEIRKRISNVKLDIKVIRKMSQLLKDFEYMPEEELGFHSDTKVHENIVATI